MPRNKICYSDRYNDDQFEYRHVVLPREMVKYIPRSHLLSEGEWRQLGVQQSQGWIHYMIHDPEPHILLFRRPLSKHGPTSIERVLLKSEFSGPRKIKNTLASSENW